MDVNVAERHVAAVEEAEDDHARDPERDDVAGRRQDTGRIILLELGSLCWPSEGRVGPQGRAKPGIEHVGVLFQRMSGPELVPAQVRLGADQPASDFPLPPGHVAAICEGLLQVTLGASAGVPDRDSVPPPELSADAPVTLFAQPVEVALGIARGMDLDPSRGDSVHRLLGETGGFLQDRPPCGRTIDPRDRARSQSCCGRSG